MAGRTVNSTVYIAIALGIVALLTVFTIVAYFILRKRRRRDVDPDVKLRWGNVNSNINEDSEAAGVWGRVARRWTVGGRSGVAELESSSSNEKRDQEAFRIVSEGPQSGARDAQATNIIPTPAGDHLQPEKAAAVLSSPAPPRPRLIIPAGTPLRAAAVSPVSAVSPLTVARSPIESMGASSGSPRRGCFRTAPTAAAAIDAGAAAMFTTAPLPPADLHAAAAARPSVAPPEAAFYAMRADGDLQPRRASEVQELSRTQTSFSARSYWDVPVRGGSSARLLTAARKQSVASMASVSTTAPSTVLSFGGEDCGGWAAAELEGAASASASASARVHGGRSEDRGTDIPPVPKIPDHYPSPKSPSSPQSSSSPSAAFPPRAVVKRKPAPGHGSLMERVLPTQQSHSPPRPGSIATDVIGHLDSIFTSPSPDLALLTPAASDPQHLSRASVARTNTWRTASSGLSMMVSPKASTRNSLTLSDGTASLPYCKRASSQAGIYAGKGETMYLSTSTLVTAGGVSSDAHDEDGGSYNREAEEERARAGREQDARAQIQETFYPQYMQEYMQSRMPPPTPPGTGRVASQVKSLEGSLKSTASVQSGSSTPRGRNPVWQHSGSSRSSSLHVEPERRKGVIPHSIITTGVRVASLTARKPVGGGSGRCSASASASTSTPPWSHPWDTFRAINRSRSFSPNRDGGKKNRGERKPKTTSVDAKLTTPRIGARDEEAAESVAMSAKLDRPWSDGGMYHVEQPSPVAGFRRERGTTWETV
ncbi:hypothetical protein DFH27DRAFT_545289 [Peziza echinospora]|nr:hypothetical protein DFH27DRAFT_545289 [Peziza echinospora]